MFLERCERVPVFRNRHFGTCVEKDRLEIQPKPTPLGDAACLISMRKPSTKRLPSTYFKELLFQYFSF